MHTRWPSGHSPRGGGDRSRSRDQQNRPSVQLPLRHQHRKQSRLDSSPEWSHDGVRPTSPGSKRSSASSASNLPFTPSQAIVQRGEQYLDGQSFKIKVVGLSRESWTESIYNALSEYGYILRIDMAPGSRDSASFVVFQCLPSETLWNRVIYIDKTPVKIEVPAQRAFTIPSPVNPNKQYNEINILRANSIDFGVSIADTTMITMHTTSKPRGVLVALNLSRKEIDIKFPQEIDGNVRKYRFRLPFSQLDRIDMVTDNNTGQATLIIPFNSPPQFFHFAKNGIKGTFSPSERIWNEWDAWYRVTDIVNQEASERIDSNPVMVDKGGSVIDIGRWTTYRILLDTTIIDGPRLEDFKSALTDHGVTITVGTHYTCKHKTVAPLWALLQEEISGTHPHLDPSSSKFAFKELFINQIHLSFQVRYQLEVCLSNGYLKEHSITREFLEFLRDTNVDEAICLLENITSKQKVYYDPMEIFKIPVRGPRRKKVPSYCVLSRSANVTPTMIHVTSPVVETSNRIIRKYAADADRFIRIKFSDEKTEGRIHSQRNNRSEAIFARIRRAMERGIVVAGRYYEFLAFGNSQFRDHGAYFYAPTHLHSADSLRLTMGSFDHIRTVAKFNARLGQCFSTTRAIKSISITIQRIPDIEANGFTFSDGVGKISSLLAQMAAQELGLENAFQDPPSLFQFRLAGCKGVLTLDPKLQGPIVCIRPSQDKFEAENQGLEVIRASAFATACFNRQLIIVLSTLGVSDYIFIRKQQEMMNDLERATKEEDIALEKLQRNIDFNQMTLTMAGMIIDGFMSSRDPFMMSLLELWRAFNIKFLKEKARIVIEKGAFVLGCVDETASLRGHFDEPQCRPNATREEKLATLPEIFLQISDLEKKGFYKVIQGVCILARNPSLHAGDIRIVRAIDVPGLRHLKNVVVLPQAGDRDLANMCSGGDLDGDDYLVMWDADFIPATINEIPMDFRAEKPLESNDPITVKQITDFFITYMKNDSLSTIALAHLAQADFNEDGVRDEKCLALARLHSQAVDYSKSGIPAVLDRSLIPKKYPHFMQSKYRPPERIYKSTNILGMLYDQVKLVDFKPQYENAFDSRILEAFQLDDATLVKAASIKELYDSALKRLMAKHGIRTEFEAWSVFVLSHNQESRDYTFAEDFGRLIDVLKSQHRQLCREAAGASSSMDFEKMAPFVAAMYTVTANEMREALRECGMTIIVGGRQVPVRKMDPENMPLISYPWLFVNELGKIATEKTKHRISLHTAD